MNRKQLTRFIRIGIVFSMLMSLLGGNTHIFFTVAGVFAGLRIGLFIVDYWNGRYN